MGLVQSSNRRRGVCVCVCMQDANTHADLTIIVTILGTI